MDDVHDYEKRRAERGAGSQDMDSSSTQETYDSTRVAVPDDKQKAGLTREQRLGLQSVTNGSRRT